MRPAPRRSPACRAEARACVERCQAVRRSPNWAAAVEQEEGVLMAAPGLGDLPLGFEDVPQLVERGGLLAAVAQRLAEGERALEALAGSGEVPLGAEHVARGVERRGLPEPVADPHVPVVGLVEQPGGLAQLPPEADRKSVV